MAVRRLRRLDVDHEPDSAGWVIGTDREPGSSRERQLDRQEPSAHRAAASGRPPRRARRAPERPVLDLELLVDAAFGLVGPAHAGEHELAPADLQGEVGAGDAGEVGLDDGTRRIGEVVDVDGGREAGPPARDAGRGRRRRRTARPSRGACARSSRRGPALKACPGAYPGRAGSASARERTRRASTGSISSVGWPRKKPWPRSIAEAWIVLELGVALDADGDDAAAELVGDLDERADQAAAGGRVLDALGEVRDELGDVGLQRLQHAQRVRAGRQVVERDHGAVLAVGGDEVLEQARSGWRSAPIELEADALAGRRRPARRAARRCAARTRRRARRAGRA